MTPKQAAFVREYLVDLNATQAAIRAGYSERTARKIGHENLTKPDIATAIAAAKAERSERTKVDADWLLLRLAEEADADVADIYDEHGNLRPVIEWPMIWRKGLVAGVETVREKVGEDEHGNPEYATVQKVKLSDRIKRLELIGKHIDVQAFKEKVEHTGAINITINPEDAAL
jgi:phage terminase small subunit